MTALLRIDPVGGLWREASTGENIKPSVSSKHAITIVLKMLLTWVFLSNTQLKQAPGSSKTSRISGDSNSSKTTIGGVEPRTIGGATAVIRGGRARLHVHCPIRRRCRSRFHRTPIVTGWWGLAEETCLLGFFFGEGEEFGIEDRWLVAFVDV